MKPWITLLCIGAGLCPVFSGWSQTPVSLVNQPNLRFEEHFDSVRSWADGFTDGAGAEHWSAVGVQTGGTIPDGITTTVDTHVFTSGFTAGVQKSPKDSTDPFLQFATSGTTDYSTALAVDFWVDFHNLHPGLLAFDASSVHSGNANSNRHSTLQVYWSVDTQHYFLLPEMQFDAVNYQYNSVHLQASLPDTLANQVAIFRFYVFNGAGGDKGGRPKIKIDNLMVEAHEENMPLRLVSFTAEVIKSAVALHWTTDSEQNTSHFEVERSADGRQFQAVGRVPAAGRSDLPRHYDYTDFPDPAGIWYYRLRMVDEDAKITYSRVLRVVFRTQYLKKIYPNPARDWVYVEWNMPVEQWVECSLIDLQGKSMWHGRLQVGENLLQIPLGNLPVGLYYLWVQEGNVPAYAFPVLHL